MQQVTFFEKDLNLIPDPDEKKWAYSRGDLELVYAKVIENLEEQIGVVNMTRDSLVNKDDGANGIEDFGISRGTNSCDMAHCVLSMRSAENVKKMVYTEELILTGKYTSICAGCGKHIPLPRLLFMPETRLCNCCAR